MIKLSFISSDDRRYNTERCLSLIKTEITNEIKNANRIVIKTSCLTENAQLGSTHFDALDEVLKFIKPHAKSQIVLADGTAIGDTINAFKNYNFFKLQDKYDLTFVDLNNDDFETVKLNVQDSIVEVKIAKTIIESDYLISVSPAKTHNIIGFVGGIYNSTIPAIFKVPAKNGFFGKKELPDKFLQDKDALNTNILKLLERIKLKLSVLDCFELMQGDGPLHGEMVPAHFTIVSTNGFAADWLATQVCSFDIQSVSYLNELNKLANDDFFVVGDNWQKHILNISKPNGF